MSAHAFPDFAEPGTITRGVEPSGGASQAGGTTGRGVRRLLDNPYWIYGALRFVAPVARIPLTDWYIVTRYAHVKEVLADSTTFGVPWTQKMRDLNDGLEPFVLGIDDRAEHRDALQQLMQCFRREDVPAVARIAADEAGRIVAPQAGSGVSFNAIGDLVTRVPTRICARYFGLPIVDPRVTTEAERKAREDEFARWAMDISAYLFADPGNDPSVREKALTSALKMSEIIDAAIRTEATRHAPDLTTIVGRMVELRNRHGTPSATGIRAHLIGMVTGFIPTNTVAAGHMLDVLVGSGRFQNWRRSRFTKPVDAAIRTDDDRLLTRCLFETLRFLPINPGPFRTCRADHEIKEGGWFGRGPRRIPAGARLLVSTQSAMFDRRAVVHPRRFDPTRSRADYMLLGSGQHTCLGIHLAEAQITATLKVLLAQRNLRRAPGAAGRLAREGPFPSRLDVLFDAP
jgi:cytochrome P450